jgi:hypothetical protein
MIEDMIQNLEKEIFDYKESADDLEISKISKEPILEAWQSFSKLLKK